MEVLVDMRSRFVRFTADDRGQDLAEYSLLIVFVLTALIGLASGFHGSVAAVANATSAQLGAAQAAIR